MEWKSYIYGILTVFVLLLALASFGLAHIGETGLSGNAVSQSSLDNIPEKCRVPAGQDLESWKEHLGHHGETKECLKYFD